MSARARGAGVALACGLSMSACSVIDTLNEGSRIDYKSAGKLPTLEVPPDLVGPRVDERFNIPDRGGPARTLSTYQAARPAEAQAASGSRAVLPSADGVRVERLGSQRFISVSAPPVNSRSNVRLTRASWRPTSFCASSASSSTSWPPSSSECAYSASSPKSAQYWPCSVSWKTFSEAISVVSSPPPGSR